MRSIYIHIPFCLKKCGYCDFVSFEPEPPRRAGVVAPYDAEYTNCLINEIKSYKKRLENYIFDTVYIGGGTPSVIEAGLICDVLNAARESMSLAENCEITIEINPSSVNAEKIQAYKNAGVNRFSVGLQTVYDKELEFLGRLGGVKQFEDTAKLLKNTNFSCDVLIGIENQTAEKVYNTIQKAIDCGAKHVSLYALKPEKGTPLWKKRRKLPDDDCVADLYYKAVSYLKERGFKRYEISNFCLDNYQSKHNLNYWKRGEYIGFGVAAHSFLGGERFANTCGLNEYILSGGLNVVKERNVLTAEDKRFEAIMLSLRLSGGLDINKFNAEFNCDFYSEYKIALEKVKNYVIIDNGFLIIKDEYFYVQNSIVLEFMK